VKISKTQRERTQIRVRRAFGKVLREYRNKSGMTQESLGDESEYHSTYISQLERGIRQPSISTLFILAKELGVKPEEMIKAVGKKLISQRRVPLKKKFRK